MIRIVTWNIQCGRGVDSVVDLDRIARVIAGLGDADVICLQEVARHFPDLDDGQGADQVAHLAARFFRHAPVFGAALDRYAPLASRRPQFGNLILSRLEVLQAQLFPLPQPADDSVMHMRRQATEVVVAAPSGPLRIATTHLEFHSAPQRAMQVEALCALHEEACENARRKPVDPGHGPYAYVPRPPASVLCGDFNFGPDDPAYARITAPFADGTPQLRDAWGCARGKKPHDPTCGIFDRKQWPEGAHCRDFFFVSEDLAPRVRDVVVDTATDASDHQPLLLALEL